MIAADNKTVLPNLTWGVPIADMPRQFLQDLYGVFPPPARPQAWIIIWRPSSSRKASPALSVIVSGKIHHKCQSAISGHPFATQKPRLKIQGDRQITIVAGYIAVDITSI
jgi:hypothetical protein